MRDFRLAAVPLMSVVNDTEGNLARIEQAVSAAVRGGADLVLLPELCLTGYATDGTLRPLTCDGPAVKELVRLADEHGATVCAGIAEAADGRIYDTQLVAEDGGLAGAYRKTHLGEQEQQVFAPGDRLAPIPSRLGLLGLGICWECRFPEVAGVLALQGADILLYPTASGLTAVRREETWERILPARAADNTCYVAAANACGGNGGGVTFGGGAAAYGPHGELLAADYRGQGIACDVSAAELTRLRQHDHRTMRDVYYLSRRRPELYGRLTERRRSPPAAQRPPDLPELAVAGRGQVRHEAGAGGRAGLGLPQQVLLLAPHERPAVADAVQEALEVVRPDRGHDVPEIPQQMSVRPAGPA